MKEIFKRIDELGEEALQFLIDICTIESPTDCKKGVDAVGEYIRGKAEKLGFETEKHREEISGDCICITMNPEAKDRAVVFSGHMDTVHPVGSFGEVPVHQDDEKIYGPGVLDCKGGIAVAFLAMRALHDCGFTKRPIKLILQSDEETSSRGSNKATVAYMAEKSKGCEGFFNCEGYANSYATVCRKGISKYLFEISGKAAHSGLCYEGVSAIAEAAQKIIELEKFKDRDGLTFNCGTISGGTVPNTVPENCTFTLDVRFSTSEEMKEADRIVEEISKKSFLAGTTCHATLLSRRVPMELRKENLELLDKINEVFSKNGFPALRQNKSNGGSDAADISSYGIPCIDSMGAEGGYAHSIREFVYKKSIAESAKRLAAIAYNI